MELAAKIISLIILFLVSIVSGLIPYVLLKWMSKKYFNAPKFAEVISIFNCFSGGVFFATSFLGILPEARAKMDELLRRMSSDMDFPLTETLLGVGFLGILLIENITTACCKRDRPYEELGSGVAGPTYGSTKPAGDSDSSDNDTKGRDQTDESVDSSVTGRGADASVVKDKTSRDVHVHVTEFTNLRSIVLVLALSVHMVFDGLELGLLDEEDKVWSLLLALCIHKSLIFFSVGLTLSETVPSSKAIFVMLFVMAIVTPIGGTLGIFLMIQTRGVVAKTVSAFLQGIAVGTFIYVTFFEILLREFNKKIEGGIVRAFAVIFGFTLFAFLRYVLCE